ncbi:MAG: hypothetical protein K0Q81_1550 [Paenibacillus sp.]|nr:hypothetical protein [Paenibacillus sp.]
MRRLLQVVVSIVLVLGLVGCGSAGSEAGNKKAGKLEQQVASIASMTIVTSATNQSVTKTDSASIERLIKAIKETKFSTGQLDIAGADYTVTVELKDGTKRTYSWWLGEKYTGLMTVTDQVGHYKLPEATKQDLLKLFSTN